MIHHISVPARDTRHVAEVIVELFDGLLTGFGPYPNSFIAWAGDAAGAAVEVYPVGTEMFPPPHGRGQANFRHNPTATPFTATHATVSVPKSVAQILAIAERESWHAAQLSRGPHDVVEFWLENHVMLELMTPEMTADYLASVPRRR